MTISTGNKIIAADYNNLLNDTYSTVPVYGINYLLGTGSGVYGLGIATNTQGAVPSAINTGTFQTVALTTISGVTTSTNQITVGSSAGLTVGNEIQITGTTISNLAPGIYYVLTIPDSTHITVSQTFGGSVFTITSTASGTMSINLYTQKAITAAQWNSLFSGMNALASHTGYTITSSATNSVSIGNSIAARSAIITNLNNLAAQMANGCSNTTAVTTSSTLQTATSSNPWENSFTGTLVANFASANAMRYFFNAGGQIIITGNRSANASGTSGTSADTTMDALYTALGTFRLGSNYCSKSGTAGTVTTAATTIGFYQLTTSPTTLMNLTGDGTYTTSTLTISANLDAAPGSSTVITFTCVLTDNDSTKGAFTAGNTASVPQYANYVGACNWYLASRNPATTYLSTVYAPSSTSQSSSTNVG